MLYISQEAIGTACLPPPSLIPSAAWRVPLMNCPSIFALSLVAWACCPVCSPSAVTLVAWQYRLKKRVINEHDKKILHLSESTWKLYLKQKAINELLIRYTGSDTQSSQVHNYILLLPSTIKEASEALFWVLRTHTGTGHKEIPDDILFLWLRSQAIILSTRQAPSMAKVLKSIETMKVLVFY